MRFKGRRDPEADIFFKTDGRVLTPLPHVPKEI